MLYMNVLFESNSLWQSRWEKKRRVKHTGAWAQCQLPFNNDNTFALLVSHHPHTACDYLHPFEINKTKASQSYCYRLLRGQLQRTLRPVVEGALQKSGDSKKQNKKTFIFLLIRPLYLKIIKKLCSPNITVSNQWRSHCLIYWGFLFCPWGEISRRPVYSWSLEVCSWGSALPGWDHRWWPRGLLDASPNHHPVPDIWLSSSVLKQQCPSYPPQIVWSGEERGVSCPRQLSDSHQYVPWTRTTSTDWAKNILTLIIMAYKQTLTLKQ